MLRFLTINYDVSAIHNINIIRFDVTLPFNMKQWLILSTFATDITQSFGHKFIIDAETPSVKKSEFSRKIKLYVMCFQFDSACCDCWEVYVIANACTRWHENVICAAWFQMTIMMITVQFGLLTLMIGWWCMSSTDYIW